MVVRDYDYEILIHCLDLSGWYEFRSFSHWEVSL
jgi:hypothetical protein